MKILIKNQNFFSGFANIKDYGYCLSAQGYKFLGNMHKNERCEIFSCTKNDTLPGGIKNNSAGYGYQQQIRV